MCCNISCSNGGLFGHHTLNIDKWPMVHAGCRGIGRHHLDEIGGKHWVRSSNSQPLSSLGTMPPLLQMSVTARSLTSIRSEWTQKVQGFEWIWQRSYGEIGVGAGILHPLQSDIFFCNLEPFFLFQTQLCIHQFWIWRWFEWWFDMVGRLSIKLHRGFAWGGHTCEGERCVVGRWELHNPPKTVRDFFKKMRTYQHNPG